MLDRNIIWREIKQKLQAYQQKNDFVGTVRLLPAESWMTKPEHN